MFISFSSCVCVCQSICTPCYTICFGLSSNWYYSTILLEVGHAHHPLFFYKAGGALPVRPGCRLFVRSLSDPYITLLVAACQVPIHAMFTLLEVGACRPHVPQDPRAPLPGHPWKNSITPLDCAAPTAGRIFAATPRVAGVGIVSDDNCADLGCSAGIAGQVGAYPAAVLLVHIASVLRYSSTAVLACGGVLVHFAFHIVLLWCTPG